MTRCQSAEKIAVYQSQCWRMISSNTVFELAAVGIGSCDYAQEVSSGLLQTAVEKHKQLCSSFPNGGGGKEMYLSDLGLE